MRKLSCLYIIILFGAVFNFSFAQSEKQIDSLRELCHKAVSDTAKLKALNQLARYYYTYKLNKQGDSVLHEQLIIAELSNNNSLILRTYFDNLPVDITSWSTSEDFNRGIQFIQAAIDFSKSINAFDYMAMGYCRMSNILRQKGENDKALSNAQLA